MRVRSLLTAATVAFALAAPAAHAAEPSYRGGCAFDTVNDPTGAAGGRTHWTGDVRAVVVAFDATGAPATATVSCYLELAGVRGDTPILGPTTGYGLVADAAPLTFDTDHDEWLVLCTVVTIGDTTFDDCWIPVKVPNPTTFDPNLIDFVIDTVDPVVCARLAALAPGVGPVVVDGTGDTYVGGTAPENLVYDCPPYHQS